MTAHTGEDMGGGEHLIYPLLESMQTCMASMETSVVFP